MKDINKKEQKQIQKKKKIRKIKEIKEWIKIEREK